MAAILRINERMLDSALLLVRMEVTFVFIFAGSVKLANPGMAEIMGFGQN